MRGVEQAPHSPPSTFLDLATVYQGDLELVSDFAYRILVSPDQFEGNAHSVGQGRVVGHQTNEVAPLVGQRLCQLRQDAFPLGHIDSDA